MMTMGGNTFSTCSGTIGPGHNRFAGIVLQEYSVKERKLIGERKNIFKGTPLGFTEGPHLYKRNGWYYLLTAEGGTNWSHAVTLARSRKLTGPYELHPDTPYPERAASARLGIAAHRPRRSRRNADRRNLHGLSLRPAAAQSRPLHPRTRNGDPENGVGRGRLAAHAGRTRDSDYGNSRAVACPRIPSRLRPCATISTPPQLPIDFQWLRTPWPEEIFSLTARPGHLRLFGRETIGSLFRQSLVARRQQSHCFSAATVVEFEPEHFQQLAGLSCYYNSAKFHYLYLSHDETLGKHLRVMSCLPDSAQTDAFTPPIRHSGRQTGASARRS